MRAGWEGGTYGFLLYRGEGFFSQSASTPWSETLSVDSTNATQPPVRFGTCRAVLFVDDDARQGPVESRRAKHFGIARDASFRVMAQPGSARTQRGTFFKDHSAGVHTRAHEGSAPPQC